MLSTRAMTVLLVSTALLAGGSAAHAAEGVLEDARPLLGGEALGSVQSVAGETDGSSGTGPCGYPHAAIYVSEPATTQALLELDVTDDAGGGLSLCEVAVYLDSETFTDPFDAVQHAASLHARTVACASAPACSISSWLPAGRRAYVVMWAAPPDDSSGHGPDPEASFAFDAKIRMRSGLSVAVYGHRMRELCSGYHEVLAGRAYRFVASTGAGDQSIRVDWYALGSSAWRLYRSSNATLASGVVSIGATASAGGRWKIVVSYPETETALASAAAVYIHYITPRWTRFADGGVKLGAPFYRQQMNLSCEAASLRTAHNFFDSPITSDMAVFRITGIDRRRPAINGGCNPNTRFCGNPDGIMMRDGYGVHYGPIIRAAGVFDRCRPGVGLTRYSNATLAGYLNLGFPVVVWGVHRGPSGIRRVAWRAWDGSSVTAWSVEHTWAVIGFHGSPSSPVSFVIADPSRSGGGVRTVSASAFNDFVKYFRTGVVVRG